MNKILRLTFMAVLSLICGAGFAQTTFNFTALYGDATISDISGMPKELDGVTVSFAKGNSQMHRPITRRVRCASMEVVALLYLTDVR